MAGNTQYGRDMAKALYKVLGRQTGATEVITPVACVKLDDEYGEALQTATGILKVTSSEQNLPALLGVGELIKRGIIMRLRIVYRTGGENPVSKTQHIHIASIRMPGGAGSIIGKPLQDPKNTSNNKGTITNASVPRRRTFV